MNSEKIKEHFNPVLMERIRQIKRDQQRMIGTITGGYFAQLSREADEIRSRLGVLSIGDTIDHQQEVYVNDEECECRTCQFEYLRRTM